MTKDLDFKEFEKDLKKSIGKDVLSKLTHGYPIIRAYKMNDPFEKVLDNSRIYFYTEGYLNYVSADFQVEVYRLGNNTLKYLSIRYYDGNPERCSYYAWSFDVNRKQMYSDMLPVTDEFIEKWFLDRVIVDYDRESDVCYVNFHNPPVEADSTTTKKDLVIRSKNGVPVGMTIINFSKYVDVVNTLYLEIHRELKK